MSDIVKDAKQELDRLAHDRDFSLVARVLSKHVEDVERRADGLQAENTRLVLENRDLRSALRLALQGIRDPNEQRGLLAAEQVIATALGEGT